MSAAASPGRTWPVLFPERELPLVVATAATIVSRGGARRTRLSGVARRPPGAWLADRPGQGDFRRQLGDESVGLGDLGCLVVSLSLAGSFSISGISLDMVPER